MKDRKKISLLILFFLCCGFTLQAQENASSSGKPISFGVRAGGVFSGFTNHQEVFTSLRAGLNAGAFVEYKPLSFLGVSTEVNYVQEGAFHANPFLIYPASTVNYTTNIYKTSSDIRLHTIQVPVLVNIRAPKISGSVAPKLILGYSFDFILGAYSKDMYMVTGTGSSDIPLSNRGNVNVSSSFKNFNMGPIVGVGFDFASDKLTYILEARYKIGITDVNAMGGLNTFNSQYDFSVNTFSVTLGIGF